MFECRVEIDSRRVQRTISRQLFGEAPWYGYPYMWDYENKRTWPALMEMMKDLGMGVFGHFTGPGVVTHDYHWKNVIGPLDQRKDPTPRFHAFDTPLHLHFGTHEYGLMLEEYRQATGMHVEGTIEVNIMSGTAEEAADWVEYMNAPNDSTNRGGGTDWAAERAKNGHPEPFGIRYWELGNEPAFTLANIGSLTGEEYAKRVHEFSIAMKRRDPTIEIMAYAPFFGFHAGGVEDALKLGQLVPDLPGTPGLTWTQTLLRDAGDALDCLYFHWYGGWNDRWHSYEYIMTSMYKGLIPTIERVAEDVETYVPSPEARQRLMRLVCAEWGCLAAQNPPHDAGTALKGAVASSRLLHVLASRKEIQYANHFGLFAPYPTPPVPSEMRPTYFAIIGREDGSDFYGTAHYHMKKLWSMAFQPELVFTELADVATFDNGIPVLDVSAMRSFDGKTLNLVLTNASASPSRPTIDLKDFRPTREARHLSVRGDDPMDNNSWENKTKISVQESAFTADGASFMMDLPAHSITALLLERQD